MTSASTNPRRSVGQAAAIDRGKAPHCGGVAFTWPASLLVRFVKSNRSSRLRIKAWHCDRHAGAVLYCTEMTREPRACELSSASEPKERAEGRGGRHTHKVKTGDGAFEVGGQFRGVLVQANAVPN